MYTSSKGREFNDTIDHLYLCERGATFLSVVPESGENVFLSTTTAAA